MGARGALVDRGLSHTAIGLPLQQEGMGHLFAGSQVNRQVPDHAGAVGPFHHIYLYIVIDMHVAVVVFCGTILDDLDHTVWTGSIHLLSFPFL